MRHHVMLAGAMQGGPRAMRCDPRVLQLEGLRPGARLCARDGTPFIRTDRTCMCFCNLLTGALCSAKDICYRYGGYDDAANEGGRNGEGRQG